MPILMFSLVQTPSKLRYEIHMLVEIQMHDNYLAKFRLNETIRIEA